MLRYEGHVFMISNQSITDPGVNAIRYRPSVRNVEQVDDQKIVKISVEI